MSLKTREINGEKKIFRDTVPLLSTLTATSMPTTSTTDWKTGTLFDSGASRKFPRVRSTATPISKSAFLRKKNIFRARFVVRGEGGRRRGIVFLLRLYTAPENFIGEKKVAKNEGKLRPTKLPPVTDCGQVAHFCEIRFASGVFSGCLFREDSAKMRFASGVFLFF